jgi:hypothetical protein
MSTTLDTVPGALERLERVPGGYRHTTLPCALDDGIAEVVAFVVATTPDRRRSFYRQLSPAACFKLLAFAERMAMLSVRRRCAGILLDGLTALVMTGPPVDREFILVTASLLHHSARKLDLDVAATFEQAARLQRIGAMDYRVVLILHIDNNELEKLTNFRAAIRSFFSFIVV